MNQAITLTELDIVPDKDIADLFSHYQASPWAMLLDASGSQHSNADFDIMVAEPIATLTTRGTQTHIRHPEGELSSDTDPLTLLKHWQHRLLGIQPPIDNLPFIGGALGFWGYDLGRRFERLPNQAKDDYQTPDMAVGLYAWAVLKDKRAGRWYLVSHKNHDAPERSHLEALAQASTASETAFQLTQPWQSNMTEAEYKTKLTRIHEYLLSGDCYQVNLAQRFSSQYQGDEWQAYLKLRQANQAPFSAFIRLEKTSIASISPERFLSVQANGRVQTKPIKGTRPRFADKARDQTSAEELRQAPKDRAENLMIVDLLRNDISKQCQPGSVTVPELFAIESFPAVHHLVSTIEGQLEPNACPLDLLRGAFPGGSITGAPKIRAMEIIDELEPHRRNIYCGSIGYYSLCGRMDTSICIRTLLCEQGRIHCWAGGGIVLDSQPDEEYAETYHKVNKILPILTGEDNVE